MAGGPAVSRSRPSAGGFGQPWVGNSQAIRHNGGQFVLVLTVCNILCPVGNETDCSGEGSVLSLRLAAKPLLLFGDLISSHAHVQGWYESWPAIAECGVALPDAGPGLAAGVLPAQPKMVFAYDDFHGAIGLGRGFVQPFEAVG